MSENKELTISNGENQISKTNNTNYGLLMKLADKLSQGGDLIPPQFRNSPEKLFTALCLGEELGLSPMQSVRSIYAVNGRPSLYGDAQLGLIKAQPDYAGIKEWKDDKGTWHCEIKRKLKTGEIEPTECEYSKNDADRNPSSKISKAWLNNFDWMMRLRARAFACRSAYPDILSGIYNESETDEIKDAMVNGQHKKNIGKNSVILEEIAPKQIEKQETVKEPAPAIELEPFVDANGKEVTKEQLIEIGTLMHSLGYTQDDVLDRIHAASSYDALVKELIKEGEKKAKTDDPEKIGNITEDMFKVPLSKDKLENQRSKKGVK